LNPLWRYVVCALATSLGSCTSEDTERTPAPATAELKGHLTQVSGDVKIKRAAGDDWIGAAEGDAVYENDQVRTAKGASTLVRFSNGSSLALSEDALIGIAESRMRPGSERTDVTVLRGRVDAELKDAAKQDLSVGTPAATVRAGREIVFQ
jgi:ferric-dicitrate binding protein FerR (iron transport regulator)